MKLELDESRRLTGPNLLWEHPGALLDVFVEGIDKNKVVECWQDWVYKLLPEVNWQNEETTFRLHTHGISLALSAPMDSLYTACELAEYAWQLCVAELLEEQGHEVEQPDIAVIAEQLTEALENEVNPRLMDIIEQAEQNGVTCITDDDFLSLGMGKTVDTWQVSELPEPEDINWNDYQDVPLALITGTNGKSTSVRLASQIAKSAGLSAGVTSTDFIKVGEHIIDKGDYSGPGGARMLVRDKRTEIAFLEVARGGILRRGLPVTNVKAALVTNVASDHLGQYGIDSVEELAEAKFVVSKALDENGVLVLNADNQLVVEQSQYIKVPICWFSESENNFLVQENLEKGLPAVFCHRDNIVYFDGHTIDPVCAIADIPMTFGGQARHNVQNAMGVVGLCFALGFCKDNIVSGLMDFGSNPQDNPGRGNLYKVNDANFIVDFAHNEHSVRAVIDMASHMPAPQKIVMFGHAGDRTNEEMQDLTHAVAELDADLYITSEVGKYLRGRELQEVTNLSKQYLMEKGVDGNAVLFADSPLSGAKLALEKAQPGSVVILFTLCDREEVHDLLSQS